MSLRIDAVVVDVLGTLVDETTGLRTAIGAHVPDGVGGLVALWQQHVAAEQRRIVAGEREFVTSDVLDAEAAALVAQRGAITDRQAIAELELAGRRLPAWPDAPAGLGLLAANHAVVALSNASRTALLHLNAYAGLRWHQALSVEHARTYKPAPEVYRLAVDLAGVPPERLLMVAAHAWDLRGAQQVGLRTAYVDRPAGDPPAASDDFDLTATDLADLAAQL